jgi:hypothetical protein
VLACAQILFAESKRTSQLLRLKQFSDTKIVCKRLSHRQLSPRTTSLTGPTADNRLIDRDGNDERHADDHELGI